ncbi:uncharacterized protein EV422DRAFT_572587 [Fimicolochytrium jonesii]|uniref:uncharacterized protein n=1 Tax=Fimicolochytrium jonesii TaxID=1396493 RepID=UPI0022FDF8F7|nr:uncharacterized protein EV422DRAFT_572587 [Fimicolochytrium jonesii]KAI8815681.1 hypothetical protein EV422DRAFT_572587 [Fimicolochytrium jonesii]
MPSRSLPTCSRYNDMIMIYGGYDGAIFLTDMWIFNITSESYIGIPPIAETIGKYAWSQAAVIGDWWILTGGVDDSFYGYWIELPLWALNLKTWRWFTSDQPTTGQITDGHGNNITIVNYEGLIRSEGAVSAVWNNKMFVYQGWQCYDQLSWGKSSFFVTASFLIIFQPMHSAIALRLIRSSPSLTCESVDRPAQQILIDPTTDVTTWTVTAIPIVGNAPYLNFMARAMTTDELGNAALLTFGGQRVDSNNAVFVEHDTYAFDFTTLTWSQLHVENKDKIPRRAGSCSVLHQNSFFFLGGHASDGGIFDMWKLELLGGANVSKSAVSGSLISTPCEIGTETTVSVQLHTTIGTPVTYGGAIVTATLLGGDKETGTVLLAQDIGNGTYTFIIRQFTSGTYSLRIYLNGDVYEPEGFSVTFYPKPPSARTSTVVVGGSAQGLWERSDTFLIDLKDMYGNKLSPAHTTLQNISMHATFQEDGTILDFVAEGEKWYLEYTDKPAGQYHIDVLIAGEHVSGSPFMITIIKPLHIRYSDPVIAVLTLFNVSGWLGSICAGVFVAMNRHSATLRNFSPVIMLLICIAHALLFTGNLFGITTGAAASCYAREWLLYIGANLTIGLLLAKASRIFILFIAMPFRKLRITDEVIAAYSLPASGIALILLCIKTALVRLSIERVNLGTYNESYTCQSSSRSGGGSDSNIPLTVRGVLMAWTALLGCTTGFFLFRTRLISGKFNDAKYILFVFLNSIVCIVIYIAVTVAVSNISAVHRYYAEAWLICYTLYVSLFGTVLVKLTSAKNLYSKLRGIQSGSESEDASEIEEVSVENASSDGSRRQSALPDDDGKNAKRERHMSMAPPTSIWKRQGKTSDASAYVCSMRITSVKRFRWARFAQWDIGIILINPHEKVCIVAPKAFAQTPSATGLVMNRESAITAVDANTLMIESAPNIVQLRFPTPELRLAVSETLNDLVHKSG